MTPLERRVAKLEASNPEKDNPLSGWTLEQLKEGLFNSCKRQHEAGTEINGKALLWNPKCRQFAKGEPWLKDANHRISVFNGFIKAAIDQNLPEEIKDVFGLGWRNVPVPDKDIELALDVLHDADLGEETPWLKSHLEH